MEIDQKTCLSYQVIFKNDLEKTKNSYVDLYKKYLQEYDSILEKEINGETESKKESDCIAEKIQMFIFLNAKDFSYDDLFEIIVYDLSFSRVFLKYSFDLTDEETKKNYYLIMKTTSYMQGQISEIITNSFSKMKKDNENVIKKLQNKLSDLEYKLNSYKKRGF